MKKNDSVIVADYSHENPLKLKEFCEICGIDAAFAQTLVEYDILHIETIEVDHWVFTVAHIERVKTTLRLHHDLEVNLPGIAIILDLLDQIEEQKQRADLLEKHFSPR